MAHHGAGLLRLTENKTLVTALQTDWYQANLSPADGVMLTYVEKLTLTPWNMEKGDVAALRVAGFSEAAILDINQVTAYYAYVNRLADGLGVELEEYWTEA